MPAYSDLPWRTGRKVTQAVFARDGGEASDRDPLIAVFKTPELAVEACAAHNHWLGLRQTAELNAMIRAGLAAAGECAGDGEPADEGGGGPGCR